jgi:MHS family proline/betaine transporter-like MFS transporter
LPELWRAPFFFGGVLALAAYLLRRHLPPEAKDFAQQGFSPGDFHSSRPNSAGVQGGLLRNLIARWPALQCFREIPRTMIVALLFTSGYGVANYLSMVFLPTFGHEFANISGDTTLFINTAGQAVVLVLVPLAGWISDRWLRRRTMLFLTFLLQAAVAWELFQLVLHRATEGLWIAQLVLAGLLALAMGAGPAMLAEQFPRGFRVSGHALVLNAGIGIAGGTAPLVAVALIGTTGSGMAPAVYLIVACLISAVAALLLRDRSRELLDDEVLNSGYAHPVL